MDKDFLRSVREGGKVRIKDLGNGKSMAICFKDGKYYKGEIRLKKSKSKYAEALSGK